MNDRGIKNTTFLLTDEMHITTDWNIFPILPVIGRSFYYPLHGETFMRKNITYPFEEKDISILPNGQI